MDRKTWLAVGLSIAGIILFQWYYQKTYGPYLHQQQELAARKQALATPSASPVASASPTATPVSPMVPASPPQGPVMTAQSTSLISEGKKKDQAQFLFSNDT